MKKTYVIHETDWGSRYIEFENNQDAKKYCHLHNLYIDKYFIKEYTKYDDFQDYINNNQEEYLKLLINGIKELQSKIKEQNLLKIEVLDNKRNYISSFTLERLKEIIEDGPKKLTNLSYVVYDSPWSEEFKFVYCTEDQFTFFVDAYNKALNMIEEYKDRLDHYKKEAKRMMKLLHKENDNKLVQNKTKKSKEEHIEL